MYMATALWCSAQNNCLSVAFLANKKENLKYFAIKQTIPYLIQQNLSRAQCETRSSTHEALFNLSFGGTQAHH